MSQRGVRPRNFPETQREGVQAHEVREVEGVRLAVALDSDDAFGVESEEEIRGVAETVHVVADSREIPNGVDVSGDVNDVNGVPDSAVFREQPVEDNADGIEIQEVHDDQQ